MRTTEERDNLLKSLEESNCELTNTFKKYKDLKENIEFPKIGIDEKISQKNQNLIVNIYHSHREALENIITNAGKLKKNILKLEKYFNEGKKQQKEPRKMFENTLKEEKD